MGARLEIEDALRRYYINQRQFQIALHELEHWIHETVRAMVPRQTTRLPVPMAMPAHPTAAAKMRQIMEDIPRQPAPLPVETTWGEIIAFRVWRVGQDGVLISSYTDHRWLPGATMKSHRPVADDDAAGGSGRTGVHGWKSVFELVDYSKELTLSGCNISRDRYENGNTIVIGRVKLWGNVVEHSRGYRAEFAKIVSLDDCQSPTHGYDRRSHWNGETLARLQAKYFPRPEAEARSQ